ncbi:MAG: hypothetical protein AAGF92_04525 [Myxococcota bacterium]
MTEEGGVIPGPSALDLAYRERDGLPMYEGQAIIQNSCGNGSLCHAPAAEREARIGVPAGLNFDVSLACTPSMEATCTDLQPCDESSEDPYCQRLDRLDGNRSKLQTWAGQSIQEVRAGTMPPGEAGRNAQATDVWLRADGTQLPRIDSSEARDVVRNWLACASPVVARTESPPTANDELTPCDSIDGETCIFAGPGGGSLPDPTWSSIYFSLIFESCLTCHAPTPTNQDPDPNPANPLGGIIPGGASPAGLAALDLSGADPNDTTDWAMESHAAVFEVPASPLGDCEGQGTLVIPGDAEGSLTIQKLRDVQTCGDVMPPLGSQTISNDVIDVVADWINMGAAND